MIPTSISDKFHPDFTAKFDYSNGVYTNANARITGLMCPIHGEFSQYSAQLRKEGSGYCPKCGYIKATVACTHTRDQFIEAASKLHAGRYRYDQVVYVNNNVKVLITCALHGVFSQRPSAHIHQKAGCPNCQYQVSGTVRNNGEKFIARATAIHRGEYDYTATKYAGTKRAITYICKVHGAVTQLAGYHLAGYGCDLCGPAKNAANKIASSAATFIDRARAVHGSKYDYSQAAYIGDKQMISIICATHGEFQQLAASHLDGRGCQQCGNIQGGESNTISQEEFLARAKAVHGDKYDYSQAIYTLNSSKLSIICATHGVFQQAPNNHINQGQGCPRCGSTQSKGEQAVADFLAIFTPVVQRDRTLIAPKELDIYLPAHKLAVEFCGEYWHSVKSAEEQKEGRMKHYNKYMACKALGIRLITIWAEEWEQHQPQMKRLLRNAIGKSKGRLMARKCDLRKVPTSEARMFFDEYHPQGGSGGGEHYGLYWKGALVACQRFAHGANDRGSSGKNRQWTLGRYATRVSVSGGSSRLFKAFLGDVQPQLVKSFSDNRFFEGGMYTQLGFAMEEEMPPDYTVWSPKIGIKPKPHYQRRELQDRLVEHGVPDIYEHKTDPRTESDMTFLMGCGRLYDCGKKRWIWACQTMQKGL